MNPGERARRNAIRAAKRDEERRKLAEETAAEIIRLRMPFKKPFILFRPFIWLYNNKVAGGLAVFVTIFSLALYFYDKAHSPKPSKNAVVTKDSADLEACLISDYPKAGCNPCFVLGKDSLYYLTIGICNQGGNKAINLLDTLFILQGPSSSFGISNPYFGITNPSATIDSGKGLRYKYIPMTKGFKYLSEQAHYTWLAWRIRYTDKSNKNGLFEMIYDASGIRTNQSFNEANSQDYQAISTSLKHQGLW